MKYQNANNILPSELIEKIQQYVQGEYIYIPIKNKNNNILTDYDVELQKRDKHIYKGALEGVSNKTLSSIYNLSESSIRRIIIKQRKRYNEMKDRVSKIITNWNVENVEVKQIHNAAWQVGESFILKVYDKANMLDRHIKIVTILDSMNIPVGKIVPTKLNTDFAQDDQNFYVLSEKMNGKNVVSVKDNPDIGLEMGNIIANLHLAFKECEKQDVFWDNSLLAELNGWIRRTFSEREWKDIDRERFDNTVSELESLYDRLPIQLIHRDVHFGNFLFHNGKFSGYIDFDLSQRNIRIFDLCYFLLGLLSEKEKFDITEESWFKVLKDVFGGYVQKIQLFETEIQAVPCVMKSIELLFVAWFISQADLRCAKSAMKIFDFVDKNEEGIKHIIKTCN